MEKFAYISPYEGGMDFQTELFGDNPSLQPSLTLHAHSG